MKRGDKIGIVCCSNAVPRAGKEKVQALEAALLKFGLIPVFSECVYPKNGTGAGSGKERAECLMKFYRDAKIHAVFDISGGDIANEILPYLDFDEIAYSDKEFWGYSDLTTIINAIYAKTGKASVLYQIRNLTGRHAMWQQKDFFDTVVFGTDALFQFDYEFLQGSVLQGTAVGGNIRCLLKLAGTPYWPDMQDKVLFLESRSGQEAQIRTYLSQLAQIGVFEQVRGILLGTFTQLEQGGGDSAALVRDYISEDLPLARTWQIGHGSDSKAIRIGAAIHLEK